MTQGDSKYSEQALWVFLLEISTISRKLYLFSYKGCKSDPKSENGNNKLTASAACGARRSALIYKHYLVR